MASQEEAESSINKPAAGPEPLEGQSLGPYRVKKLLGAGGMGEVYLARDSRLHRDVAIKVLPRTAASDSDQLRRFEQEARAASLLNHPNIVNIYDIGSHQGAPFLVYERLEGETLRERLRNGPLPPRKAMDYALQTARGLAQAHAKGIIHRDLKPENLFLTSDGRVKILDFGLAKLKPEIVTGGADVSKISTLTREGAVLGTVGYMAPEQVRGQPADHRADLFALGAILYEMVGGQRAFRGDSDVGTMNAILTEEPPPLADAGTLPPGLKEVIAHCLAKNPADRYQSAQDLAFNLELLPTLSSGGVSPVVRLGLPWARRRSLLIAIGIALAALGIGVFTGRTLWHRQPPFSPEVRVHRLTEFTGLEQFPALSPDGRSIAFTAGVEGQRQIWVRLVAGGPALQITRDSADHLFPRWSRDSSSLAYFSPPIAGEDAGSIWEVSALGGRPRRLVSSLTGADLSPADNRLAFFRLRGGKIELVVGASDGSGLQTMAELETGYVYGMPRWSPDSSMIAYERRYRGFDSIFVIRNDERKPIASVSVASVNGFAWLPDSSGVVVSSARGSMIPYLETFQLWSVPLGGGQPRQLTFGEVSYVHPDLNHAGGLVASRLRMRSDLWRIPVRGDGAENVKRATPVTRQTAEVRTPSVSPDGREVVYLSDIGGHSNLWVTSLETGEARQLTFEREPNTQIGVPVWSPDGRQIAFYWKAEKDYGYSLVHPDGSGLHRIIAKGWWACWSPDARWLYYADQEGSRYLKKVPAAGGSPVVVRHERAWMPALSPDGQTFYFAVEVPQATGAVDYEIRVARPENGPSHVLARIGAHRLPEAGRFQPVISPDGQWLALPLSDGLATNIWAIATKDGSMRRITDYGHHPTAITRRVSWSPDGRSIFAAVSEGDADIVMFNGIKP